ncbi:MAG: hypothetical protein IT581_19635 [Verrucomicrobiales bacterium]|nr:hypothetical protein [Verrucomicrobiales bacterium]
MPSPRLTPIRRTVAGPVNLALLLLLGVRCAVGAAALRSAATDEPPALWISVYTTAGDVLQHLGTHDQRARVAALLEPLKVTRLFLEGRRGDEYVPPTKLAEVRDFFAARGVECTGGIATVPGSDFATRQKGALGWLNWESARTRQDVAGFFTANAPVFPSLIVDDFYCTADESPDSVAARGSRPWGDYRRDLLSRLIPEIIVAPARAARPDVRLILKFPQWYDRFHLFGYDPARMMEPFDAIWVGTEVRNPLTRRMGFVQPTEGYINFRWLRSVGGKKVVGAWFDHIECSAQNFIDQAFLSVLAGASELTLFHLGDLVDGHPGDAALAAQLPELRQLSANVRSHQLRGIPYYKPPGSDPGENLYLMDYLAMAGWPIVPVAEFPYRASSLVLAAPAAADPTILDKLESALKSGAVVTVTPAFIRIAGPRASNLAGLAAPPTDSAGTSREVRLRGRRKTLTLDAPLDIDASVSPGEARATLAGASDGHSIPLLTTRRVGRGRLQVLNLRTFSEQDFRDAGEWLLAPRPLGISTLPASVANILRQDALHAIGTRFEAPAGVALHLFEGAACLYNFHTNSVAVRWNRNSIQLPAHGWRWLAAD